MADYKFGEMDIQEQEKTFDGFVRLAVWVMGGAFCLLAFLALFYG